MDSPCIFLGIKVKPGPIERFKLENYTLDNTVDHLKTEAEKKANVPSSSLELIHHGKILKSNRTLKDSGVKNGEMVHVVKKKQEETAPPRATYTDAELQGLNTALRSLGCTPNAPGWTRAMQLLNDEAVMNEILDVAPSLGEDCVALSILHEVELLAALGANIQTMRRGAEAHPELPAALMHLMRLERARADNAQPNDSGPAISGFAYSLEALSEEEDADEDDAEDNERGPITQEQLAAALQAATEAVSATSRGGGAASERQSFLQMLRGAAGETSRNVHAAPAPAPAPAPASASAAGAERAVITPEMFSEAISEAITRAGSAAATPMEQTTEASSSQSPARSARDEDFTTQLNHMHEMGLLDDAFNVRALIICAGDVNAAINLVFSGAIGDD